MTDAFDPLNGIKAWKLWLSLHEKSLPSNHGVKFIVLQYYVTLLVSSWETFCGFVILDIYKCLDRFGLKP